MHRPSFNIELLKFFYGPPALCSRKPISASLGHPQQIMHAGEWLFFGYKITHILCKIYVLLLWAIIYILILYIFCLAVFQKRSEFCPGNLRQPEYHPWLCHHLRALPHDLQVKRIYKPSPDQISLDLLCPFCILPRLTICLGIRQISRSPEPKLNQNKVTCKIST